MTSHNLRRDDGRSPNPIYFLEASLGRYGRAFLETDRDVNSREYVLGLIVSGERVPLKVLEVDEEAGSCRDVTAELMEEAAMRCALMFEGEREERNEQARRFDHARDHAKNYQGA